jgi:S-adenosylmethionine hydrolase
VAARLAAGEPLAGAGAPLDPAELVALDLPEARVENGELVAHVLLADRFGNVVLDAGHGQLTGFGLRLGDAVDVTSGGVARRARYATTFADVASGELLVYEDAQRHLALAVNRGSAAGALGLERDGEVRLRPAGR